MHHALVYLPQVHQLVDETEYSLRIPLDDHIDITPVRVIILFHQSEQRCEDQCHRCAYLMTDVHEEAQFGLTHLLSMDMLLEPQFVLFLTVAQFQILPYRKRDQTKENKFLFRRLHFIR